MKVEEIFEIFMPLLFLAYTHFLDERVHNHLQYNDAYHIGKTKWVFRYQWEICFLNLSLLLMLGVRVLNGDELRGWIILGISSTLVVWLTILTILILTRKRKQLNAIPFYISIFSYGLYIILVIIYNLETVSYFTQYFYTALIISMIISAPVIIFVHKHLKNVLVGNGVLKDSTITDLIRISKSNSLKGSGDRLIVEALKRIVRKAIPGSKEWKYAKGRLENEFPSHKI